MTEKATSARIGQPVRRKEDLRLVTGNGSYTDDVNLPGQAYAVMVRSPHAHARIRGVDIAPAHGGAGRARGADRPRSPGRRAEADSPQGVVAASGRSHARGSATASRPSRRRIIRCRPTRCASSARRSPWWWPRRSRPPRTAPSGSAIDYEALPAVTDTLRGGAPRCAAPVRGSGLERRGRRRARRPRRDRGGLRPRRPCGEVRHLGAARHRRADGAARGGVRIRSRHRAATRSMPAAAAPGGSRTISPPSSRCRPIGCASSCARSAAISAPAA